MIGRQHSAMRLALIAISAVLAGSLAASAETLTTPPTETPAPPAQTNTLDSLYDRLAKAKTDDEAKGIAGAIERAQLRSGSDTADLLMTRALTAIKDGKSDLAVELLSATVKLSPDFAEAWNKRATLYYLKNDYGRSMVDIAETLKREPRHFGAWAGLGMILRETGDKKRAYDAFKRALAVNPHLDTVQKAVEELKPEVEGRDI